jgi:hypothetical protein
MMGKEFRNLWIVPLNPLEVIAPLKAVRRATLQSSGRPGFPVDFPAADLNARSVGLLSSHP